MRAAILLQSAAAAGEGGHRPLALSIRDELFDAAVADGAAGPGFIDRHDFANGFAAKVGDRIANARLGDAETTADDGVGGEGGYGHRALHLRLILNKIRCAGDRRQ